MTKKQGPKLTTADWRKVRADWESGRVETLPQLARQWGVPLPTVKARKRRGMWTRNADEARRAADALPTAPPPDPQGGADDVSSTAGGDGDSADDLRDKQVRAVLERHLGELALPRAMLRAAVEITRAGKVGKVRESMVYAAKGAAQALRITQAAERDALGIKPGDGRHTPTTPTQINVYLKNEYGPPEMEQLGKVTTVEPRPTKERPQRGDDVVAHRQPDPEPARRSEKAGALVLVGGGVKE